MGEAGVESGGDVKGGVVGVGGFDADVAHVEVSVLEGGKKMG